MTDPVALPVALHALRERFEMASKRMAVKTGNKYLDAHRDGQRVAYFDCARELAALLATPQPPEHEEKPGECGICHCTTGGGAFCFEHVPYMVYPQADGSFLVDRHGRKRVSFEEPPTRPAHQTETTAPETAQDGIV